MSIIIFLFKKDIIFYFKMKRLIAYEKKAFKNISEKN